MKYFSLLFLSLFLFLNGFSQSESSDNKEIELSINNPKIGYLFYQTPDLKELEFQISGISDDLKSIWITKANKTSFIESLNFVNGNTLQMVFKKSPSPKQFREFLNQINIHKFYVNEVWVYTETLLDNKEIQKKAKSFKKNPEPFKKEWNDPALIEHYQFNVYHFEAKMNGLFIANYAQSLYNGSVAKIYELQLKAKNELDLFTKNNLN